MLLGVVARRLQYETWKGCILFSNNNPILKHIRVFSISIVIKKWYQVKRISKKLLEKVRNNLIGEVKDYDTYLTGEVYETVKETYDKDKNQLDYDAIGGYFEYGYSLEALKTDI